MDSGIIRRTRQETSMAVRPWSRALTFVLILIFDMLVSKMGTLSITLRIKAKRFICIFKKNINREECYCGNNRDNYGNVSIFGPECNMPCDYNTSQICGGKSASSLYQIITCK